MVRGEGLAVHDETQARPKGDRLNSSLGYFTKNSPTMFYINDDGLDTGKRLPESVTAQETSPPLFAGRGDFVGAEHRKEPLSEPGLVASALRGIVIHEDPKYFVHHCRKWEEYGERWRQGQKVPNTNEGLLQHQDLRPVEHEYGEDSHWSLIPGRLGTGSFGDVYMARDHSSNFTCAAKQIHVSNFQAGEVLTWSRLTSPWIVPLYGGVRHGETITLFMKLLPGGSVAQLIRKQGSLPEALSLHYTGQVLQALQHLHSLGIVHGDVKADNMLLSRCGYQVSLCDFGHSTQLSPSGITSSHGGQCLGTVTHMAPEVLKGVYGLGADSWSTACTLLHMLSGHHPWQNINTNQLMLKIVRDKPPLDEIPASCSALTASVIRAGLVKDPAHRDTVGGLRGRTDQALRALQQKSGSCCAGEKPLTSSEGNGGNSPLSARPAPGHPLAPDPPDAGPGRGAEVAAPPAAQCRGEEGGLCSDVVNPEETPVGGSEAGAQWERCYRWNGVSLHSGLWGWSECEWGAGSNRAVADSHCDSDSSAPQPLLSLPPAHSQAEREILQEEGRLQTEFLLYNLSQVYPEELESRILDALSSGAYSLPQHVEQECPKADPSLSGMYSSGIHSMSWNSQTDPQPPSLSHKGQSHLNTPSFFNGVQVRIHSFDGERLVVHDVRGATVGRVASGISNLVHVSSFSLVKPNGKPISPDLEIPDSGIDLMCAHASNYSNMWSWRIQDGSLHIRP
ncbi:mitogen-activated protein kinase kinase kinase 14 [Callorhinchus milii]|uniref:mitogen-activated protein kinase kinase kinase 14 n=1 Tax=Callorhinchus milii TaxID=7868 RepID=UPI001C3FC240|nr:mitogen-activated protein kinase kinase kinase 14 [Callorhinchus milii]